MTPDERTDAGVATVENPPQETAAEVIARLRQRVVDGKPVTIVGAFAAIAQRAERRPIAAQKHPTRPSGTLPVNGEGAGARGSSFERAQLKMQARKGQVVRASAGEVVAVRDALEGLNRRVKED